MLTTLARIATPSVLRLARHGRRWKVATAGVAAVEFALVLPVMIALYFGLTEVTPAINIQRKLTLTARGLADLSSRAKELSTDELKTIFGAAFAIMRPYDTGNATQMVVSSVLVTKVGNAYKGTVDWSCGWNLPLVPAADDLKIRLLLSNYTVPASFQNADTLSFILVETQYSYTPMTLTAFTGTVRLSETTPWPVRGAKVAAPPLCPLKV